MRSFSFGFIFLLAGSSLLSCGHNGLASHSDGGSGVHSASHDEPRPFDSNRDASADVDRALDRAAKNGTLALIVMGGNWCHDSRGFAAALERPQTQALIADHYERVWVDVGYKTKNQHIARRFGLDGTPGTPTVVIARPDGTVLNADTAPTWRNAASRSPQDIHDELASFVR